MVWKSTVPPPDVSAVSLSRLSSGALLSKSMSSTWDPADRPANRRATEFHTLVGNFILCAILGKKPAFGVAIKSEQVRMTAAIFYAKTKMGWKETVVNEQANKDDKPFLVDDARQRLIDEVDRIRARKEQKGG